MALNHSKCSTSPIFNSRSQLPKINLLNQKILFFRADKESWIQAKYVDKKFTSKVRKQNHLPNGGRLFKRKNVVRKKSDGRLRTYSLERVDVLDMDNPVNHLKVTPTSSCDSADTASDDDPEPASLHPNMVRTQHQILYLDSYT